MRFVSAAVLSLILSVTLKTSVQYSRIQFRSLRQNYVQLATLPRSNYFLSMQKDNSKIVSKTQPKSSLDIILWGGLTATAIYFLIMESSKILFPLAFAIGY
jgi:hypothetical protein